MSDELDERVLGADRQRWRSALSILSIALRADPWRSTAMLALTLGNGLTTALAAYSFKLVVDAIAGADAHDLVVACAITALAGGVRSYSSLYGFLIRQRVTESTQLAIDLRLMELTTGIAGMEHHERADYVDQLTRLRERRSQLSNTIGALMNAISVISETTGTIGVLASVHPIMFALPLAGIPSFFLEGKAERIRRVAWESTTERYRAMRHLFQLGTSPAPGKELRIFGLGALLRDRHRDGMWSNAEAMTTANWKAAVLAATGWLLFAAAFFGCLLVVAHRVIAGDAGPGDIAMVLALGSQMNAQVAALAGTVSWLLQTLDVVRRYLWLEDHAAAAAAPPHSPQALPASIRDGIRFEHVEFTYPGTERPILSGVDLHLPAGSTVAVVGDNGAGKSTLVKLLCRFYEPTSGRISIDGVPLEDIDVATWRSALSAGFQDFARPELSAGRSVGIGDLERLDDDATIGGALDRASATDVVDQLADGLGTQLGKTFGDGVELSGGQWQKLALGRAMMRVAPLLLVLDEPTAAIDAETEHALFERFTGAAKTAALINGAITVLVSHRFSTVRMADLIVVVDGGGICEVGSHDELMARGGLYAELFELQASGYR
jgi:ABC-type multidrug transport system fused ATPase/permease subunit